MIYKTYRVMQLQAYNERIKKSKDRKTKINKFFNKLKNKFVEKPVYLEYKTYENKIKTLDILNFRQNARKRGLKNE